MNCGLRDPKLSGSGPNGGAVFYDMPGEFYGSFFNIPLQHTTLPALAVVSYAGVGVGMPEECKRWPAALTLPAVLY